MPMKAGHHQPANERRADGGLTLNAGLVAV